MRLVEKRPLMKGVVLIILLFGAMSSGSQDLPPVSLKGDSLFIDDSKLVNDPFGFGKKPLTYLKSKLKSKKSIEVSPIPNQYVEHQVDTSYKLKFAKDSFQVYQTGKGVQFLISARVVTKKFKTRHGFQVGMSKPKILAILKAYPIEQIPGSLFLGNLDYSFVKLAFKGDTLDEIVYFGYLD